jgi:hypothetical protein
MTREEFLAWRDTRGRPHTLEDVDYSRPEVLGSLRSAYEVLLDIPAPSQNKHLSHKGEPKKAAA